MSKLDVLIRRITETENALCKEMEQEDLGFALDYGEINETLVKELCELIPSLSNAEQEEAIEFLKAYDEHIKDQQKYILAEQNKVKELYKNVKKRHNISNKYSQTRKNSF